LISPMQTVKTNKKNLKAMNYASPWEQLNNHTRKSKTFSSARVCTPRTSRGRLIKCL
jgi:hypothetical protein